MPSSDDASVRYDIELTDEALFAYAEIPSDKLYARIGTLIDFLAEHPWYGQEYDPYYRAAMPPVDCRVFYCGYYGVYYNVNEAARLITILAIEDQRRDPLRRFQVVR